MQTQLISLTGVGIVIALAFLLMRLMWRQMRRVNAHTAQVSRQRVGESESAPIEEWDAERGQYVRRDGEPNEELLRQGARSRASGWYLEP